MASSEALFFLQDKHLPQSNTATELDRKIKLARDQFRYIRPVDVSHTNTGSPQIIWD